MAGPLKASIAPVSKKAKTHDTAIVKFTITNTGDQDVSVLTWNTPLDRVLTDCLDVTVDGKGVGYDGPMIKRSAPQPSDYMVIKAGQSVETEFPVSDAYDTSKPGTYKVKLKTPIADVAPKQANRAAAVAMGKQTPVQQSISARTSFKVETGAGAHLTQGAAARDAEALTKQALTMSAPKQAKKAAPKKKPGKNQKAGPLAVLLTGGTASQQASTRQAHGDGYDLCVAALAGLTNSPQFVEWFGAHAAARLNKVNANYAAVKLRMETIQFTYNLTGSGCKPGVYAYTYKGTSTIWYCDAFWSAPATGTDSKAGTVLHEHTHSDAMTDDVIYGQAACRNLASTDPGKAITNADSHEYYAGG